MTEERRKPDLETPTDRAKQLGSFLRAEGDPVREAAPVNAAILGKIKRAQTAAEFEKKRFETRGELDDIRQDNDRIKQTSAELLANGATEEKFVELKAELDANVERFVRAREEIDDLSEFAARYKGDSFCRSSVLKRLGIGETEAWRAKSKRELMPVVDQVVGALEASGLSKEDQRKTLEKLSADMDERDKRRIQLEAFCKEVFFAVKANAWGCPVSLLLFEHGEEGNVAYKTMSEGPAFAGSLNALAKRFRMTASERDLALAKLRHSPFKYPDDAETRAYGAAVKAHLAPGIGAAILIGEGEFTNYVGVSSDERTVMADLFDELAGKIRIDLGEEGLERRVRQVVRDWHCPAGEIKTASHREVFAMNVAHAEALLEIGAHATKRGLEDIQGLALNERFGALIDRIAEQTFVDEDAALAMSEFLKLWRSCAFARLEVGHKLAAALCLTDVPDDIEVKAPWEAWSLVIPDGLLPPMDDGKTLARVWMQGTNDVFAIASDGVISIHDGRKPGRAYEMLRNLILGACLALSNPDDFKKERQGKPSSSSGQKKHRSGPPDLEQARYMLSAPVKVDLRDTLREYLGGTHKGSSPKVQFLVRGHWKNQAHGKGRALRKRIFVEPFWKGPEEARVLLRQHKVEE